MMQIDSHGVMMIMVQKQGLLLLNLGTPDAPNISSVGRFLEEFLMDPAVIPWPTWLRSLLVRGLIIPLRVRRVTEAYQTIWRPEGSPLAVETSHMAKALKQELDENVWSVAYAYRYGAPHLMTAFQQLSDCQTVWILPLYPQFAQSTTGSMRQAIQAVLEQYGQSTQTYYWCEQFETFSGFVAAQAQLFQQKYQPRPSIRSHILVSFHGLPVNQLKPFCSKPCGQSPCKTDRALCYRQNCFDTARALAQACGWSPDDYTVSFQSRLGKAPWIQPYTETLLETCYKRGVRDLYVLTPSFVTDCLETEEEIGIRLKAAWKERVGETGELYRIPCVNTHPIWIQSLVEAVSLIRNPLKWITLTREG